MWFRLQFKPQQALIYNSLNGAFLRPTVAKKMKAEGMLAGVPDLTVLCAKGTLHIELKAPDTYSINPRTGNRVKKAGGIQSPHQKFFQDCVENYGQQYHLCDNFNDFQKICKNFILGVDK